LYAGCGTVVQVSNPKAVIHSSSEALFIGVYLYPPSHSNPDYLALNRTAWRCNNRPG
jgi:hypothetical protein